MQQDGPFDGEHRDQRTAVSPTGDPRVDEVLAALEGLGDVPVAEHAAVLLGVHERLTGVLTPEQARRPGGAHGAS